MQYHKCFSLFCFSSRQFVHNFFSAPLHDGISTEVRYGYHSQAETLLMVKNQGKQQLELNIVSSHSYI